MKYLVYIILCLNVSPFVNAQNNYNMTFLNYEKNIVNGIMHVSYQIGHTDLRKAAIHLLFLDQNGEIIIPERHSMSGDIGRNIKVKKSKTYNVSWSFRNQGIRNEKAILLIPMLKGDASKFIKRSLLIQPYMGISTSLSNIRVFSNGTVIQKINNIPEVETNIGLRLFRGFDIEVSYSHSGKVKNYKNNYYSRFALGGILHFPLWNDRFRGGLKFGRAYYNFYPNEDTKINRVFLAFRMEAFINMHSALVLEARLNDNEVFYTHSLGVKYYF